jgi:hypothetical protein
MTASETTVQLTVFVGVQSDTAIVTLTKKLPVNVSPDIDAKLNGIVNSIGKVPAASAQPEKEGRAETEVAHVAPLSSENSIRAISPLQKACTPTP